MGVLGLGLGLQTLNTNRNTKPSQDTVRIGVCPVTGQSLGSDKSPPRPRHRYSPPQPRRNPCIVCITRASVSVTGLEVTSIVDESPNGYYLIPRRAHSVLKWVDTHTRTATCRTLDSIGVRTDVPTLMYTSVQQNRSGSPTVRARIRSLSGIAPVRRIAPIGVLAQAVRGDCLGALMLM